MIAKLKRSMWVGGIAVIAFGAIMAIVATTSSVASAADGQVWVCKYVGQPGVDERLKDGKNPDNVSKSATVGDWFKDGQDNSYVLDVVTAENTGGNNNSYIGDKKCPLNYASVTWSVSEPTCNVPAILTHSAVNAILKAGSTPSGTSGPGPFSFTYTGTIQGIGQYVFANGSTTETHSGTLAGVIPAQSTNPQGACYVPPVELPRDASVVLSSTEPTCDAGAKLEFKELNHAQFTTGDPAGTEGSYSSTFTADAGHLFTNGLATLTLSGDLAGPLTQGCGGTPEEGVATATFNILPAYCDAGQTLKYGKIENAQVNNGSTLDGTEGPKGYNVTVTANSGFLFAADAQGVSNDRKTITLTGELAGPLTGEDCVLGEGTTTPGTTTNGGSGAATGTPAAAVAQLPETDGEATAVIAVGGSLLAVVAGLAGIRRFLTRGL